MLTYEILLTIGFTIDFMGKLLVSYTAVSVHHRVWKEHKIDEEVFRVMGVERKVGILGIALMVIGFIIELYAQLNLYV